MGKNASRIISYQILLIILPKMHFILVLLTCFIP